MPFIIGTMKKAQLALLDTLASKVEKPEISSRFSAFFFCVKDEQLTVLLSAN